MKKRLLVICLVSIMVLGITGLAFARHPNAKYSKYGTIYGPPVINDDAGTNVKGTLEWGTSVAQTWDSGFYTTTIISALTYGITDYLEVYVAPTVLGAAYGEDLHKSPADPRYATLIRAYGNHGAVNQEFPELWVGAKYMFLEEVKDRARPGMAVKYGLKIPCKTDSKYFTTGEVDHKLTYCVTKSLDVGPRKLQLDGNVAFRYYHEPDSPRQKWTNEWSWGTSAMYPIARKALIVAELLGKNEYRKVHMTRDDYILDGYLGTKVLWPSEDCYFKTAIGKRLSDADPDILGYFGLVYYFHL